MKTFLILISLLFVTSCASVERFIDDAYDGDPRMTEIKGEVDSLKDKLGEVRDDAREKLRVRLGILREEAEMLGDLKKAEFELKLQEMKSYLETIKSAMNE